MRHDIDGSPIKPVSPEDRVLAQERNDPKIVSAPEAAEPAMSAPNKAELIRASLLQGRSR
jgi:hypothetical protein